MRNVLLPDGELVTIGEYEDVIAIVKEKCGDEIAKMIVGGDWLAWHIIGDVMDFVDNEEDKRKLETAWALAQADEIMDY